MKKSYLKEKLRKKAEQRAQQDLEKLHVFLTDHPIAKHLEFTSGRGKSQKKVSLVNNYSEMTSFIKGNIDNKQVIPSNLQEVYKKLVDRYEQEETDNMLNKLDSLEYLIQDRGF